jgi:hypothetical protein
MEKRTSYSPVEGPSRPAARLALACLILLGISRYAAAQGVAELEKQYAEGRYLEAVIKLHEVPALDPEVSKWLAGKAEAGVPPFQYEYSRRLADSDMPAAIRWFARGFVVRSLDVAECTEWTRAPGHIAIRQRYSSLNDKVLAQPAVYAAEAEQAIDWERRRPERPSARWICDDRMLPVEQRQAARERQTIRIREGIARLKARAAAK